MIGYTSEKILGKCLVLFLCISGGSFFNSCNLQAQDNDGSLSSSSSTEIDLIDPKNYAITQFSMVDGLPQHTINDIIQTEDGYIWLATFGGLVRFDGISFTTYDRSNTEGMRSDRVLHMFEDSRGALWLGTEDGFLKFKNGEFTSFLIEDDSFVYSPSTVKEDDFGTIWLMAAGKPFKILEDSLIAVETVQDSVLADKAVENAEGVWLAHEFEIFRTLGDTLVRVANLDSTIEKYIMDFVELPKNSGEYFFGTTGEGVFHYKDDELKLYSTEDGLASRYAWNFYVDSKQNLWVTSYLGISVWNGGGFTPVKLAESSEGIQLNRVLEDTEGNYWIGSLGDGLFKLRPSDITTIGLENGLKNDKMLSLTTLNDGRYLFATNCGGVYEYEPSSKKVSQPSISAELPNQCIWSVFQDSKDRIWFGSRILYRSNSLSETGVTIDKKDGFTGRDIFTISEDSKGNIWIGALNGLYKYDGESYFRYSTNNGLSYNDTRAVFEDRDGVIWVGTSGGLNKIVNGTAVPVDLIKEQGINDRSNKPYVRAIHQDEEGVMWIGTYGNGIFRIKDGATTAIKKEDGLHDNIVSHIEEDKDGYFWMGSNRGIFRVHKSELNEFAEGKISRVNGFVYGMNDGMLSSETNGGFEPNVINNGDGKLYFPTISGVAVVSTENPGEERRPPKVYIESVKNGDNDLSGEDEISLEYNNAFLQINYTALSFRDPGKITFRYTLEGLNDHWFEVEQNRTALYTKIPPGEYTFKVAASNNSGPWSTEFASLGISVAPPFWQTSWFYALVFILFGSTGPGIYYLRVNQLKRENERKKRFTERLIDSQEQERRRIASELHDGLGQQILVMKNRAEMAQQKVAEPDEVTHQLQEIMESAIISIGEVRSISHGLRPIHLEKFGLTEAIENLCDQLQRTSKIEWSYHIANIDGLIPQSKEINLYRVIQEATNNIQKHSFAEEASVMMMRASANIKVTIWDDGKGFDVKDESLKQGLGFSGMYERIETLGGLITFVSKPAEGTTINIVIPIS
ncbi:MAG TPA: hypothetical protein DD671_04355 [Balneolaceae bacterium]|nr:hypothetical protein [Balneolaceae bacterium]